MYKRLSAVLFPVLLIALIGTGVWGYQEYQEKNTILIKAENQYQRAFHDLAYHMDRLQTELGNTLAVNSTSQDFYRKGLVNVWRMTSQAQNEINQLPLTLLPFNKTEEFLDNMAKFSYRTAVRDLNAKPLSDDERNTLQTLYTRSKELTTELQGVQTKVLAQNLRWMDVETALASEKEPNDNTIIDGFKTVDKKVSEFSEVNWGPTMESIFQKRDASLIQGDEMTPDQIKQKAMQFLGLSDGSGLKVVENGNGIEFSSYSVSDAKSSNGDGLQMDYTKKGGHLISFMSPRPVQSKVLDQRGARDAAAQFLDQHGFASMTAVGYDEYNNVASVTFAGKQGDVIVYPEKVTVQVALDNGDVTGLQATDYVYEHKQRQLKTPSLTKEQAAKELSPDFQRTGDELALIRNDLNEEVLCYQFDGKINGADYKIYINGDTGYEEKIEQIHPRHDDGKPQ